MNEDRHNPDSSPSADELTGRLRDAVEEIRRQPMPQDRLDKAIDNAQSIQGRQAARPRDWRMPILAAASILAVVSVGLWVWTNRNGTPLTSNVVATVTPSPEDERDLQKREVDVRSREAVGSGSGIAPPATTAPMDLPPERRSGMGKDDPRSGDAGAALTTPRPTSPGGAQNRDALRQGEGAKRDDSYRQPPGAPAPMPGLGGRTPPAGAASSPSIGGGFLGGEGRSDPVFDEKRTHELAKKFHNKKAGGLRPGTPSVLGTPEPSAAHPTPDGARVPTEGAPADRESKGEKVLKDAERKKKEAQAEKGREKKEDADKEKGEERPQVWKKQAPPTFARVHLGDGNALELVSLHVTVTVEGPRARTFVDHVFRNPHDRQLEGTFEYPLPTGASPSYFAMFLGQTRDLAPPRFARRGDVAPLPEDRLARLAPADIARQVSTTDWGRLQEARVVGKQKALETYEEVVRGQIDPALMEHAGGNTFRGRVFPIPAKGYNRVLLAYEEPLAATGERLQYQFPLPDCKLAELQLTLNATAHDCKQPAFLPQDARKDNTGSFLAYTRTWQGQGPGGTAAFTFVPTHPHVQAITSRQGESGPLYVYARVRPELKIEKAQPFAKHAVFLLDTSLSEHPDRFDLNMKLLRAILEADQDITHFNVLTFNAGAAWVEPKGWFDNTAAGREKLFARLDGLLLEGATDLGAALEMLALDGRLNKGDALDLFLLSDGQVTWGEADAQTLVSRFEARCGLRTRFNCYRTGLGAENLELYSALTRRGGGVFNCFTPDAIKAAATAHRSQCLQVENVRFVSGPKMSDQLIAGRQAAVYPDGDLVVVARAAATGRTLLVVEGTFNGQKFAQEYPLELRADGELAARGWGEIAVASLLALNDPSLESLATAYSQEFGIASQAASFLVLENDTDYKRFNLEAERGKTLTGDMGKFLTDAWTNAGRTASARETYVRFLNTMSPRVRLFEGEHGAHVRKLLTLLGDKDFEIPELPLTGALLMRNQVPPAYLALRDRDLRDATAYLAEARRRSAAGDADGAARVLSSVIEQNPGRDDALRLVGYRLLDLKQPSQAARLFGRVQKQRPFEPHSYRDLARSLEECGLHGLAAVQYETVLAGTWHNRFGDALKAVAREEYASMMRDAVRRKAVTGALADHFGNRLEGMSGQVVSGDLRVTISWNTDATDVDLWVLEPDGTKCFYSHNRTKSGGELSQDQTQGYGPERYRVGTATKGTYKVMVHYFRANQNLLAGETHVNVIVTRAAGTPQESVERHTVILKKEGEASEVCKVAF